MPEAISLKFGMWSTEVGGNVHSKICLVSSRQHRATEVRKLRFLSSCQYTHGVARRLLGPHDTLLCVLISLSQAVEIAEKGAKDLLTVCSLTKDTAAPVSISMVISWPSMSRVVLGDCCWQYQQQNVENQSQTVDIQCPNLESHCCMVNTFLRLCLLVGGFTSTHFSYVSTFTTTMTYL